jgi:hypothetical protein
MRAEGRRLRAEGSDLLICGILFWGQIRVFGLSGEGIDESQAGSRIGELGGVYSLSGK